MIFDGWESDNVHYITIFASFTANTSYGFDTLLLAFARLENEVKPDPYEHISFLKVILEVFRNAFSTVVAFLETTVP